MIQEKRALSRADEKVRLNHYTRGEDALYLIQTSYGGLKTSASEATTSHTMIEETKGKLLKKEKGDDISACKERPEGIMGLFLRISKRGSQKVDRQTVVRILSRTA